MPAVRPALPVEDPLRVDRPPIAQGSRCLLGLILLLESCALVGVVGMSWLLLRYVLTVEHTAAPPTAQAARMLQYWATLLFVHALAFAWFRRAASPRSALLGFVGILYLGCSYVFSLALAAVFEIGQWPEEWKMVSWTAILPLVAWSSSLLHVPALHWLPWDRKDHGARSPQATPRGVARSAHRRRRHRLRSVARPVHPGVHHGRPARHRPRPGP